jgi:hypothetical protein
METQGDIFGESLLAVVGVTPLLDPKGRIRLGIGRVESAAKLQDRIRARLRKFCTADGFDTAGELPEFDAETVLAELARPIEEIRVRLEGQLAGTEEAQEEINALMPALGRALAFLQSVAPRNSRVTLTGAQPVAPSEMSVSRLRRIYDVVNDPLIVLDDMNEGCLARQQVDTLRVVYPALKDYMRQVLFEEMTAARTADDKWTLPYAKERVLAIFLGVEAMTPALAKELQAQFGQSEDPESAKRKPIPAKSSEASMTPTQKVEHK